MLFSSFIEKQIPCMRRYAFAMIGDLSRADECLAQVLEGAVSARNGEQAVEHLRKVDLFIRLQKAIVDCAPSSTADIMRQLILLLEMEQFSIDKASVILNLPLEELWRLANSEGYVSKRAKMSESHDL